jgi:hypothetical protein
MSATCQTHQQEGVRSTLLVDSRHITLGAKRLMPANTIQADVAKAPVSFP